MSEPLWTPVGEDTGAEVLAINDYQKFAIGKLQRCDGEWACNPEEGWPLYGIVAYIPLSRLVTLSKIKPVASQPMYRPKRFKTGVRLIAQKDEPKGESFDGW